MRIISSTAQISCYVTSTIHAQMLHCKIKGLKLGVQNFLLDWPALVCFETRLSQGRVL